MSENDFDNQVPNEQGTYPQLTIEEPELTTFAEPEPEVEDEYVEHSMRLVNSQENWDILNNPEHGIKWTAENETQTQMMAVFYTREDLERARIALDSSSEPYPLTPD